MTSRRHFLRRLAVLTAPFLVPRKIFAGTYDTVMTVSGPISAARMKFTLSHEHILVDFIGAKKIAPGRYQVEDVIKTALPHLLAVKENGCFSFVDCTPAYLGRDVALLKELSAKTGLNILTPTGYYGAAGEKHVPEHAYSETAQQLANSWISEWNDGIEGTGIRPGFIKTGVDRAPLTAVQQKLLKAAAITHLATGLTIGVHTGDGPAAEEQLTILQENGVHPSARIWIHAQNEKDMQFHVRAAQRGSWVSFDGVNTNSLGAHVEYIINMKKAGHLDKVLVSQDSGWYHVGEPGGGTFNHYNTVFTDLIPALKQQGITTSELELLFVTNPSKAFTVQIRRWK